MKTTIIAAIAIVAVAALGAGYYRYQQTSSAAITVMYDITDPDMPRADTSEVPRYIASHTSKWGETSLRFLTISDFRATKANILSIPAVFPLLSNPYQRDRELQTANKGVLEAVDSLAAQDTGRTQSVIYAPIADELNRLAANDANTKELIVYSDLQENMAAFSTYRQQDSILLQSHPEKVVALFEKEVPLGSLKGITIHFVYGGKTPSDQDRFLAMANLLGGMFRAHGATVAVTPNLTD